MALTAKIVPFSSVVGSSVALHNEAGATVALLMISIPSPSFPYKETALPIAEKIAAAFNTQVASPASLTPDERLIWLLGDLMNAAENYFGAENPKREGHIYCSAARIIDEVISPVREQNAEMLAALKLVRSTTYQMHAETLEAVERAIAKAEGRS